MEKETRWLDNETKVLIKRLAHAAEHAFADHAILRHENERLLAQNHEKRGGTSQPARKLGNAKVMNYEYPTKSKRKLEAQKPSEARKRKTNASSGRRPERSCGVDIRKG